jgi:microsomal prostaglandin-E synthase 2
VSLYQYDICPFCCKVKAYLNWQKMPYTALDVNPLTKSEISFSKEYKKVPIAVIDGTQVSDSSMILDRLITMSKDQGSLPATFSDKSDPEISKWLEYVDKKLAVLLFPNITRNMLESWEAFGYINKVPHFGLAQKLVLRLTGSVAMRLANGKIKRKYSIEDERVALKQAVDEWVESGLAGKKFHGGEKADLADIAVYGCLTSIQEFTAFSWLLEVTPSEFLVWFNRMKIEIGESSCVSRQ